MLSARITAIILPVLLFCAGHSYAAPRALIILGETNQSLTLNYQYSGMTSTTPGEPDKESTNHRFLELYDGKIKYSLLSPRYFNGELSVGVRLDQNRYSLSGRPTTSYEKTGLKYGIGGVFFDRAPVTVNFMNVTDYTYISRPFGESYAVDSNSFVAGMVIKNDFLPFWADYLRTVSETDGSSNDRRLTTERLSLRANYNAPRSRSELSIISSKYVTEPVRNNSFPAATYRDFLFSASNSLTFPAQRISLGSAVTLSEVLNQNMQQTLALSELFRWDLGKALLLNVDYQGNFTKAESVSSVPANDTTTHFGSVTLSHRLYQSLDTRVSLSGRQITDDYGDENFYSGILELTYTKKLSEHDGLRINFSERHSRTDRNMEQGSLFRQNEELIAQVYGSIPAEPAPVNQDNLLQQTGIMLPSVEIRDNANRGILYERGFDYEFTSQGAYTGIDFSLPSSRVVQGQALLVTYSYGVDSNVTYESYARNFGVYLALSDRTYQFSAAVQQTGQNTISGNEQINSSYDDSYYSLDASWQRYRSFAGVRYVYNDSEFNPYQYIEGTARTNYRLGYGGISLLAKDKFTRYDTSIYREAGYDENLFTSSAGYTRPLFGGSFQISANYNYYTSDYLSRYDLSFETIYRWMVGRLSLDILAKTHLRDMDRNSQRNDQLSVRITRTF